MNPSKNMNQPIYDLKNYRARPHGGAAGSGAANMAWYLIGLVLFVALLGWIDKRDAELAPVITPDHCNAVTV